MNSINFKKIRTRSAALFLLLAPCFLFTSCQPKKPTLKIGINAELTGEVPSVGASCLNAAKLFAEQVNEQGGLLVGNIKIPLSLIVGDNGDKADQAAAVSQRLISQEGVLAMVGPNTSACAIPAAEIAESLGCLMISPWSTNPQATLNTKTGKFKKNVFRACYTDAFEVPALVKFAITQLHLKKAAVLYDISSEYSNSAAHLFKQEFSRDGGTFVAMETYTTGDRDFSAQLTKIKMASPDVIFLPSYYNDVPLIAEQARRLGVTALFLGGNAWSTPAMLTLDSGHHLNGSFFANHFSTQAASPQVKNFITDYQKKYNQPPDDIAALTYDTMGLLAEAIVKAGKAGKPDRTSLRDAMASIETFTGVTGNFIYLEGSHDPMKSVVILTIKNGAFDYMMTVEP